MLNENRIFETKFNIQLNKKYDINRDCYTLNYNLEIPDGLNNQITCAIMDNFNSLPSLLYNEFRSQGELYKLINESKYYNSDYSPSTNDFSYYSSGFTNFINELTQDELDLLKLIVEGIIQRKYDYYLNKYSQELETQSQININTQTKPITITDVDIKTPLMFFSENKGYTVEVKEIENCESLDSYKQFISEELKQNIANQLKIRQKNEEKRINQLKKYHQNELSNVFADALIMSETIKEDWTLINKNNKWYLRYNQDKIIADKIYYEGKYYSIPNEIEELYVEGLLVEVKGKINNNDVLVEDSYNIHFHEGTLNYGCLGDLKNKPLKDVIDKLPNMLTILNFDSPLNEDISEPILKKLFGGTFYDGDGDSYFVEPVYNMDDYLIDYGWNINNMDGGV